MTEPTVQIIRRIRLTGLTRAEIADRAGINPKTVGRIMAKKHSPKIDTIQKIVRVVELAERTAHD